MEYRKDGGDNDDEMNGERRNEILQEENSQATGGLHTLMWVTCIVRPGFIGGGWSHAQVASHKLEPHPMTSQLTSGARPGR